MMSRVARVAQPVSLLVRQAAATAAKPRAFTVAPAMAPSASMAVLQVPALEWPLYGWGAGEYQGGVEDDCCYDDGAAYDEDDCDAGDSAALPDSSDSWISRVCFSTSFLDTLFPSPVVMVKRQYNPSVLKRKRVREGGPGRPGGRAFVHRVVNRFGAARWSQTSCICKISRACIMCVRVGEHWRPLNFRVFFVVVVLTIIWLFERPASSLAPHHHRCVSLQRHGFRARQATVGGRRVLKRRRQKGRHMLSA